MWMSQTLYNTIIEGMNIHKSQLFWCEQTGTRVLTHNHMWTIVDIHRVRLTTNLLAVHHIEAIHVC